ncbi:MAG: serine protease [Candidatus Acidiferrales bacterium]
MRTGRVLFLLLCLRLTVQGQEIPHPLAKVDVCEKFSNAVVRIQTGRPSHGTGFIVSQDGWILTASHVVLDWTTGEYDGAITVILPDNSTQLATPILKADHFLILRDFAILKIDKNNLPFLTLGDEDQAAIGSDVSIIGFPISAQSRFEQFVTTKFCLFGSIAARQTFPIDKINVEAIYFQGVSVKGISGAPLISLKTGKVIGIANLKLAGINDALKAEEATLGNPSAGGLFVGDVSVQKTVADVIDTLDRHLANGLGAATGINDAKYALAKAQRNYKKENRNAATHN